LNAKLRYQQAMEWLYIVCVVVSGLAMIVITLIIPLGVFMRYVMNNPLGWPEPAAVIMMVIFSFVGGAAVYRAKGHIAVEALLNAVSETKRKWMLRAVDVCIAAVVAFMIYYGIELVVVTRYQTVAEFPSVSVALVYLPIPVSGLILMLFLLEKVWVGEPPKTSVMFSDEATELE
jgi:TRAP-type C4-dicarboxylate transport system permease small subunit